MNAWRITSLAAGFVMAVLVYRFSPSWRELLVFLGMYALHSVSTMRVGMLLQQRVES